LYCI